MDRRRPGTGLSPACQSQRRMPSSVATPNVFTVFHDGAASVHGRGDARTARRRWRLAQLTSSGIRPFTELDVELHSSHAVFVRIHELSPVSPRIRPHLQGVKIPSRLTGRRAIGSWRQRDNSSPADLTAKIQRTCLTNAGRQWLMRNNSPRAKIRSSRVSGRSSPSRRKILRCSITYIT